MLGPHDQGNIQLLLHHHTNLLHARGIHCVVLHPVARMHARPHTHTHAHAEPQLTLGQPRHPGAQDHTMLSREQGRKEPPLCPHFRASLDTWAGRSGGDKHQRLAPASKPLSKTIKLCSVPNEGSSGRTRPRGPLKDAITEHLWPALSAQSEIPAWAQKKFLIRGVTIFTHSFTCRPGCSKVDEDTTPDRR